MQQKCIEKWIIHWDIIEYYIIQTAEHHLEVMAALFCSCLSLCFCFICLYSCTTLCRSSSIILFLAIEGLLTDIGLWPRREFRRRPLVTPWRKEQDDNNEQTALISISKSSRGTKTSYLGFNYGFLWFNTQWWRRHGDLSKRYLI